MQYKNFIYEDFKYTHFESNEVVISILNGLSMTTKIVMHPKEGGKSGKFHDNLG